MNKNSYLQFEKRKKEHIKLALMKSNQTIKYNILDKILLTHNALPNINFKEININSIQLGKKVIKPFLVSSMTAGHKNSININYNLIKACSIHQWSMGVGSQRRELTDINASSEWIFLRKHFPNVSLFSNLGITQLIHTPFQKIQRLIDTLQAKAIIIHCNPLQEILQPEGIPNFKGCFKALDNLVKTLSIPVIVKETGCGFSKATLKQLKKIGIAAVDVSGLGGTHWGRIEGKRTKNNIKKKAAITFGNWGITTIQSIKNAISLIPNFEIWGSGGVRNGLDAAKLFALGVNMVGFAQLMLNAAIHNSKKVCNLMKLIEYELKIAMFCTGSHTLKELKGKYSINR
ncbi:type 2 isopentenyl-diphosphate Delta-isomerase [Candidatus Legionella polyplacis]|uniref:Isopentenyl-diphosphate delta-isomerase n=1 Tax=Candidatus Legionella polyplacis TaxID=2005262 RepID=A0ABZ2GZG0_9GAMM|nr:type 2 isopentenyl-diphosphate Delta-isomerase [Candidatus Legionella polyplacis]ATW01816.1 type 2 isopentenyl-diphosphate Delta-isomerase [Candidatus Legionella polyplacis]